MEKMAYEEKQSQLSCINEYDSLRKVIMVPPKHMQIKEVINEVQMHYLNENIDIDKAMAQHTNFMELLEAEGASVIQLQENPQLNEQVFTRDIGFTIGNRFFVSSMKEAIRKEEESVLVDWLIGKQIPHYHFGIPSIEGGDVVVHGSSVYVGMNDRTSTEAIELLKRELPGYDIIPIRLREDILHLDCIFNIISEDTALIYPPAMETQMYEQLQKTFRLIEVTEEEQFQLGPNVLSIGSRKVISLPENSHTNEAMREKGFTVIEVPFSEIIKSGGSFRCCTLPLLRG